jgi:SAM-dependent methyltransferase
MGPGGKEGDMGDYEAHEHYKDADVAERYDRQFRDPRGVRDLRARVFGEFEELAFRHMLVDVGRGGAVLDVACGTGRYTRRLLDEGFVVTGCDISPQMLDVARRATGPHPGLQAFEVADAAQLPFADQSFDGITCMRLYHRVPSETRVAMLREVRRVGRGWAILFFGMSTAWLTIRRAVRRIGGGRPSDPYPVTIRDLESELDAAGLELLHRRWVMPGLADGMVVRVGWSAERRDPHTSSAQAPPTQGVMR